jgi:uncharacterized protein YdhG (YjbR/CyaY superfamily)
MQENKSNPATIDEYIAQYPQDVQQILAGIRAVIHETVPEAVEKISYGMPCFYQNGNLVWFGAHQRHIGFYPRPSTPEFKNKLSAYKQTKGSVHFPLDKPMPFDLIREIVKFRIAGNQNKSPK